MSDLITKEPKKETLFLEFDVNGTVINFDTANTDPSCTIEQKMEIFRKLTIVRYLKGRVVNDAFIPDEDGYITYKSFLESKCSKKERHEISQNVAKGFEFVPMVADMYYVLSKHKDILVPSFVELVKAMLDRKQSFVIMFRTFGSDLSILKEALQKEFPDIPCPKDTLKYNYKDFFQLKKEKQDKFCQEFLFFQDDYKRWSENGEKAEFGKDFAVTPNSFFFDDNETIVNSRDEEGNYVPNEMLPKGCRVVLVNNYLNVADKNYFLNLVYQ